MAEKVRIMLVDDHAIVREGLRAILALSPDFEVVGEAGDGREALEKAKAVDPDVVIMDVSMPGMDGLEATKRFTRDYPGMKVLVLSQHDNDRYVLPILQAGAAGYVLKRSIGAELVAALRAVHNGECYLPPRIAQTVLQFFRNRPSESQEAEDLSPLTEREREVLKLVVEGNTSQSIADLLCVSKRTVMCHRANIAAKLSIHNRTELVRYAIRMGIIEPV
ncbi:MAG: response regulator [Chloroflexota bacterium]